MMFAFSANDLPRITAVGDIIYLKDAQMQTYSKESEGLKSHQIIFNVNNSNVWAIYPGLNRDFKLPDLLKI